ncbi:MMPL family transporter [Streptomyces sp. NPDC001678]|uniref:MMPL family transporter n=1 Tax=Streptomyces sp. NPDC001678 TaxID=3364599 RepID=UPI0036BD40B9
MLPSSKFGTRIAGLTCGRVTKWLVVLAWAAILAVAVPMAGKLKSAESTDSTSSLPSGAQSTLVAEVADRFPGGDRISGIIVYSRDGGITADDRAKADRDRQAFARMTSTEVAPARTSQDGKALALGVSLPGDVEMEPLQKLQDQAKDGLPQGLEAHLTGSAGDRLDSLDSFKGLDGTLMLVAAGVVALLLLLTYRSPVLWMLPLIGAVVGSELANSVVYLLAKHAGLVVNGKIDSILVVLVFGAGTDYALLLIARYREELRNYADRHEAMAVAVARGGPAIIASAGTVCFGLLCLMAAQLKLNQSLGPVAAAGIVCVLLAMLTLLPALLTILGRWVFWPLVPKPGTAARTRRTVWDRIGSGVSRRPRTVWIASTLLLAALATGAFGVKSGLDFEHTYRTTPDSVTGQKVLSEHFSGGGGNPVRVVSEAGAADEVAKALRGVKGVAEVRPAQLSKDGKLAAIPTVLTDAPTSKAAEDTVDRVRDAIREVPGADAKVGNSAAATLDIARAQAHDRKVVIPLALAVVFVLLGLLLRALVAPLLLIATVVVSYFSSLGASWLLFKHVLGFPAVDDTLIIYGFIFLVTLGVDYNIFLVHRMREEVAGNPTDRGHRDGVLRSVSVTGGVITSAGAVLAATFAALAVLPLVSMTELGIMVALGVLLDTFLVRSILVPALALDTGRKFWAPSRLSARRSTPTASRPTDTLVGSGRR